MKTNVFNLDNGNGFYLALILVVLGGCIVSTLPSAISDIGAFHTDDSARYLIDFSSYLGTDWTTDYYTGHYSEDLFGRHLSIVGTSQTHTHNQKNARAFIHQHTITYSSADNAYKRYRTQQERVFVYSFGVPPSRQLYPYEEVVFRIDTNPNANEYYIGCEEIYDLDQTNMLRDVRCSGLFLYGKHIVFLDIYPTRDYVTYLTEDNLIDIFSAVDNKMTNPDTLPFVGLQH